MYLSWNCLHLKMYPLFIFSQRWSKKKVCLQRTGHTIQGKPTAIADVGEKWAYLFCLWQQVLFANYTRLVYSGLICSHGVEWGLRTGLGFKDNIHRKSFNQCICRHSHRGKHSPCTCKIKLNASMPQGFCILIKIEEVEWVVKEKGKRNWQVSFEWESGLE